MVDLPVDLDFASLLLVEAAWTARAMELAMEPAVVSFRLREDGVWGVAVGPVCVCVMVGWDGICFSCLASGGPFLAPACLLACLRCGLVFCLSGADLPSCLIEVLVVVVVGQ